MKSIFCSSTSILLTSCLHCGSASESTVRIEKDKKDGIKAEARYTTLNDMYELWKDLKRGLKNNTFENYKYMYETFVRQQIGSKTVSSLKKSDIKRFYNYLADERHLKPATMANEDKKDFNAMLMDSKDMPKVQIITDEKSIEKYGGDKMYFAPPIDYDKVMRLVPCGKLLTVGTIRDYFAKQSGADFTEPITAGIFVSIVAWASYQRAEDKTPYWRTLKANGELNAKYPGGVEAQKEMLEKEGHTVIQKGRTNIKYYVKDYEKALFTL